MTEELEDEVRGRLKENAQLRKALKRRSLERGCSCRARRDHVEEERVAEGSEEERELSVKK